MAGIILLACERQKGKRDTENDPRETEAEPSRVSTSRTKLNDERRDDNKTKCDRPKYLKRVESKNKAAVRCCLMGRSVTCKVRKSIQNLLTSQ